MVEGGSLNFEDDINGALPFGRGPHFERHSSMVDNLRCNILRQIHGPMEPAVGNIHRASYTDHCDGKIISPFRVILAFPE